MSHTPGPWRAADRDSGDYMHPEVRIYRDVTYVEGVQPTTYIIGSATYPTSPRGTVGEAERMANARLIAAAPELLKTLRRFAVAMRESVRPDLLELVETLYEADAAIDKATGGAR